MGKYIYILGYGNNINWDLSQYYNFRIKFTSEVVQVMVYRSEWVSVIPTNYVINVETDR